MIGTSRSASRMRRACSATLRHVGGSVNQQFWSSSVISEHAYDGEVTGQFPESFGAPEGSSGRSRAGMPLHRMPPFRTERSPLSAGRWPLAERVLDLVEDALAAVFLGFFQGLGQALQ